MSLKGFFGKYKINNAYINATFIYIIANGVGQGITLLSNVFFTRYMSKTDYGLYSNYYSYVALLGPFIGLNLYYGLINAYTDYKDKIKEVRSSLLLLSLVGCVSSLALGFILIRMLKVSFSFVLLILATIHAYGFFLINFFAHSMNMENKYIYKGWALAAPNMLQAVTAAIAVFICNNYISRAIGSTVSICTCGALAMLVMIKSCKPRINFEYWSYALKISLPAIIGSVSSLIMQQSDKTMLTSLLGADYTAVYSLVYYIGYILLAVQQATNGVWIAWIYKALGEKRTENIEKVQKWYLFFMVMVVSVLYMLAPDIIRLLSPKEYWEFNLVIPFVTGSFIICINAIKGSIIQYNKRTDIISAITVVAAVVNVFLNYVLINRIGMMGAAIASVVAYIVISMLTSIYLLGKGIYLYKARYFVLDSLIIVILGCVFYYVADYMMERFIVFLALLFAEIAYCFIKQDEIKSLIGG